MLYPAVKACDEQNVRLLASIGYGLCDRFFSLPLPLSLFLYHLLSPLFSCLTPPLMTIRTFWSYITLHISMVPLSVLRICYFHMPWVSGLSAHSPGFVPFSYRAPIQQLKYHTLNVKGRPCHFSHFVPRSVVRGIDACDRRLKQKQKTGKIWTSPHTMYVHSLPPGDHPSKSPFQSRSHCDAELNLTLTIRHTPVS